MKTLSLEEALEIALNAATPPVSEQASLQDCLGRILADNLVADSDVPPFDRSAVDGFACRRVDLRGACSVYGARHPLIVRETLAAGKSPEYRIEALQCSRIMTGAMVPPGADTVIMVENSEELADGRVIIHQIDGAVNIRRQGEDVKTGEVVLHSGCLIHPAHVAVLASFGLTAVPVYRQPRVAVVSTGDELVEPGDIPGKASIRDSNRFQLIAQIKKMNGIPVDLGISRDTEKELHPKILTALESNDVVLLSGGVSMGMYDLVPRILTGFGADILFRSIAIQPGRPTLFGRKGNRFIFGLAGNPVSSFVLFEILVKPFLYKLTGYDFTARYISLPMGTTFSRKKAIRRSIVPILMRGNEVFPLEYHGSAHINAYVSADGMISVPEGVTTLTKGELQDVRLL